MFQLKTFHDAFGSGKIEFSVTSLRVACETLGLRVWSTGAAWGFDRKTLLGGERSYYLNAAFDVRSVDDERKALTSILASTRRGRRMIRQALQDAAGK